MNLGDRVWVVYEMTVLSGEWVSQHGNNTNFIKTDNGNEYRVSALFGTEQDAISALLAELEEDKAANLARLKELVEARGPS